MYETALALILGNKLYALRIASADPLPVILVALTKIGTMSIHRSYCVAR